MTKRDQMGGRTSPPRMEILVVSDHDMQQRDATNHVPIIAVLALLSRLIPLGLLILLSYSEPFDSSAQLQAGLSTPSTLRWDAIHFASIARNGYQYEQQIAFQPGWPLLMRTAGHRLRWLSGIWSGTHAETTISDVELGGVIVGNLCFVGATVMMYKLTAVLATPAFAFSTSLLYILPPTPAVLSSAYTENFFALLTFTGFYAAVRRLHLLSALCLAAATSIRATGIFSGGLLAWLAILGVQGFGASLARPATLIVAASQAAMLSIVVASPFIAFQWYAYRSFCSIPETIRPWCASTLLLPYSFVQREYWNVGLLKYWTFEQIPNLVIAAPVLVPSIIGSIAYLRDYPAKRRNIANDPNSFLLPFHLHHLFLTFLLVFSSHTQITLRVVSGDPVLWWNVSTMTFDWRDPSRTRMSTAGQAWVWWVVLWGAASLVLWAGHYPPA